MNLWTSNVGGMVAQVTRVLFSLPCLCRFRRYLSGCRSTLQTTAFNTQADITRFCKLDFMQRILFDGVHNNVNENAARHRSKRLQTMSECVRVVLWLGYDKFFNVFNAFETIHTLSSTDAHHHYLEYENKRNRISKVLFRIVFIHWCCRAT